MKYYNVFVRIDLDEPREMPPLQDSTPPWYSVGYFQTFFCTEKSKDKAKMLVCDYIEGREENGISYKLTFERIAWMRWITKREQIAFGLTADLTEEMFSKRDRLGIWYAGDREHFVSEEDYTAVMQEECNQDL